MIKLNQISVRHGAHTLLDSAGATIFPGHKVGLVGANGSGKSSLFAVLRGELATDTGDVDIPKAWALAHMAQYIKALDQSAIDFVLDGDEAFRAAELAVTQAESKTDQSDIDHAMAIASAHEALEAAGGYQAPARAARLLAGLGFGAEQFDAPIASFSGGWRIRLSLAKALMCPSDLLLLDEPTNHLDLETVTWLEGWLKHYPGTLVVISHDRDFLDAVADTIIHIEHLKLHTYKGDYTNFEKQRAERLSQQQSAYVKQQQTMAHMQQFVDRFRAQASKAKAAQSRLKALSRLEAIAPAHLDSPFDFEFATPPKVANPLVHLDDVALGYGEHRVIDSIRISLAPGDRIGLLGLNGAGKSTLIKAIAGELPPLSGRLSHARGLNVGYFAQHQIEQLNELENAIWHIARLDEQMGTKATEQMIRDFLGGFDFSGDLATSASGNYSGGEKARLVLALLVRQKPNLLLLDEPTNHLDLEMRHALTVALQTFEGAVIVVSHDRHLLNNSVDQFWLIHQGHLNVFDGDLNDYRAQIKEHDTSAQPSAGTANSKKQRRQEKANQRNQLKPLQNKLKSLSARIEKLTQLRQAQDDALADSDLYHNPDRADEVAMMIEKRGLTQTELESAETEWMGTAEALESAGGDAAG